MDTEVELTSAVEDPGVGGTSTAEGLKVGWSSASEGLEVGGTSATEGPKVSGSSAADSPEIEVTSVAEGPEVGGSSSAEGLEVRRYWKYDSTSSSDSIFRAPAHIRCSRESDFEPKLVSIGPFYRGLLKLQPMEETKVWCMSNLLMMQPGDKNKGECSFLFYNRGRSNMECVPIDPFKKFERRARSFYKEKSDQISDVDEFVQMLFLDSCFVIRILLSFSGDIPEGMGSLEVNIKEVRSDLLLLENQIPLFFIHEVYYWLFPNVHESIDLVHILDWFINLDLPWEASSNCLDFESDHLLDFYWKTSVPHMEQLIKIMKSHKCKQTTGWEHIPRSLPKLIENATELHQTAGIKFEKHHSYGLRVEFSKAGIMRMFCLKIDSSLVTTLVNLLAFEDSKPLPIRIISTYIKTLDELIDSEKDVDLLHKFDVIYNTLSSHKKMAYFFNDIGKVCVIDKGNNPFSDMFRDVNKYYRSSWNRGWASLQQNLIDKYFSNPWAGISAFAGGILLILTVLQTYYTIYGYYNPRN